MPPERVHRLDVGVGVALARQRGLVQVPELHGLVLGGGEQGRLARVEGERANRVEVAAERELVGEVLFGEGVVDEGVVAGRVQVAAVVDADARELAQVGVASEAVLFQEQLAAAAREVRCAWRRDVIVISNVKQKTIVISDDRNNFFDELIFFLMFNFLYKYYECSFIYNFVKFFFKYVHFYLSF